MRTINKIIIHCADTYDYMDIGVEEIMDWHLSRGWTDIGYHYVIRRDGTVEGGRSIEIAGAHCRGQNHDSIGICLVGGKARDGKPDNNFTDLQFQAMYELCGDLAINHEGIKDIYPHHYFDEGKVCPCFRVVNWLRDF